MVNDTVAQAVGLCSFLLGISTFYQKEDKKLKVVMLLLNVNHLIHFLLLGSITSAIGALISALRTCTAMYTKSWWAAGLFVALAVGSGVGFAQHWHQLLPLVGSIIGTYSIFKLNGIALRVGFLLGAACWLTNNLIIGSIGGSLMEISVIGMNLFTIFRLYQGKAKCKITT
ncbi:permease [Vibrio sp. 10N.286.49.C2]|uniref:YgjV family protein n=1 Tax=unclassified Vibrio TaxID=2614977 RepID=UPI000C820E53|nr:MULTISPECIES: YgjV family protein [unclassified Vibrio]PMH33922.1 permease [Vibrio sp. 10N.286.49.C2]PMH44180.1 permease [Vibrio sp. 10N.286.49.B1]PMH82388.1 permease [Vibrio sp. 10N.286.48.B7]